MPTFVTIVFVIVSIFMVLVILMQAGKGGGLGSALGGGASQTVFGGGGGADVMAKITQGFAAAFMISAVYLAYASSHTDSSFLEEQSEELEVQERLATEDGDVDYETVGPRGNKVLKLPTPEEAASQREAAGAPASMSMPGGDDQNG